MVSNPQLELRQSIDVYVQWDNARNFMWKLLVFVDHGRGNGCAVNIRWSPDYQIFRVFLFRRKDDTYSNCRFQSMLYYLLVSYDVGSQPIPLTHSLYFLFLQRPLQAWTYLSISAARCQLLLRNWPPAYSKEDHESIRRIFWACFVIER